MAKRSPEVGNTRPEAEQACPTKPEIIQPNGITRNPRYIDWRTQYLKPEEQEKWKDLKNYIPKIKSIFQNHCIPADMVYLIYVESEGDINASTDGTKGPFQMKESTAEKWGLKVVPGTIDERLDIFKAATAAALELRDMYERFGSWSWAMIGYNLGEFDAVPKYDHYDHSITSYIKNEKNEYLQRFHAAKDTFGSIELEQPNVPREAPVIYNEKWQRGEKYTITQKDTKIENFTLGKLFTRECWGSHTTLTRLIAFNIKKYRTLNPPRNFNDTSIVEGDPIFVPHRAECQIDFRTIATKMHFTTTETTKFKKLNPHLLDAITTGQTKLLETTIYFETDEQRNRFYTTPPFSELILSFANARNEDAVNTSSFILADNLHS